MVSILPSLYTSISKKIKKNEKIHFVVLFELAQLLFRIWLIVRKDTKEDKCDVCFLSFGFTRSCFSFLSETKIFFLAYFIDNKKTTIYKPAPVTVYCIIHHEPQIFVPSCIFAVFVHSDTLNSVM